ncbi:unnamed protein product, partial [Brassica rapa]
MGSVPKVGGFPPLGAHGPFQPTPAPLTTSLAGWMPNPSVSHPTVSAGPIGLGAPNSAVGTNLGDIAIWEVGSRDKLASRSFKVWDLATCTGNLQASLASEYTAAVNRVIWSPDGGLLG